jgi:hypothetical protein
MPVKKRQWMRPLMNAALALFICRCSSSSTSPGRSDASIAILDGGCGPDAACAMGLTCAEGGTCNAATEFCQLNFASSSGPFGQCVALPSACLSAPSCKCIMAIAALSFQTCTESYPVPCTDSSGQIVVTCAMP